MDSARLVGTRRTGLGPDFWKFWIGQTISNVGSWFTYFALPLLVYKLTGSAVSLAITTAAEFLPQLLFGLVIGALMDRVDRKRMMIITDIARALVVATIPVMDAFDALTVWWIYGVGFASATLTIFFDSGQFAAIPSLVSKDELVAANGRLMASMSAGQVLGPMFAGVLVSFMSLATSSISMLRLFFCRQLRSPSCVPALIRSPWTDARRPLCARTSKKVCDSSGIIPSFAT
ncbi:MAG: MFS transporter [Actinomycetota bacterium]